MSPTEEILEDVRVAHPEPVLAVSPRLLIAAVIATGIAFDLMARSSIGGLAGVALALALIAVVACSRRVRLDGAARVALALAAMTSLLLGLRTSEWLVPLNFLAVAIVVFVAASLPSIATWRDLPVGALSIRTLDAVVALLAGPALLRRATNTTGAAARHESRARAAPVVRGLLLALPVIAVLCALLASGDAVFASFFTSGADPGPLLARLALAAIGVWCAAAVWWFACNEWEPMSTRPPFRLGVTEAAIVLGSLVAVYALFVASQIVARGADVSYILQTTGLTRAEYARSGFFQLLWAAGLTLLVLLGLHWFVGADRRAPVILPVLQVATIGLTVSVVVIAVRRLGLYSDAYGLTMLRLYCTVFAWWLGAVMVVTGIYLVRHWPHRWLPVAIGALAFATLVALNVANPERIVVEHNLAHAAEGADIDLDYFTNLSDDAVPALVAGVDQLSPRDAAILTGRLCARTHENEPWYGANLSTARANAALADLCG